MIPIHTDEQFKQLKNPNAFGKICTQTEYQSLQQLHITTNNP